MTLDPFALDFAESANRPPRAQTLQGRPRSQQSPSSSSRPDRAASLPTRQRRRRQPSASGSFVAPLQVRTLSTAAPSLSWLALPSPDVDPQAVRRPSRRASIASIMAAPEEEPEAAPVPATTRSLRPSRPPRFRWQRWTTSATQPTRRGVLSALRPSSPSRPRRSARRATAAAPRPDLQPSTYGTYSVFTPGWERRLLE